MLNKANQRVVTFFWLYEEFMIYEGFKKIEVITSFCEKKKNVKIESVFETEKL